MLVTLMQEVPAPPLPPDIPGIVIGGGPPVAVFVVAVVGLIVTGVLLLPIVRAWARRLERGTADPALQEELEQMRSRVAELEELHHRVAELEERVDFSERVLAQRAPEMLPRADA